MLTSPPRKPRTCSIDLGVNLLVVGNDFAFNLPEIITTQAIDKEGRDPVVSSADVG